MTTAASSSATSAADRQWYIVGRWQEYEGEARANLVRVLAVIAFYVVQLVHFYGYSNRNAAETAFHTRTTAIAAAWTILAVAILFVLRAHMFPAAIKYISSACDLVLLTAVAALAAGPSSVFVRAYPVIIVLAALRFSLPLVWFCTLGSIIGYMALVGMRDEVWFDANHAVPPTEQAITLLSLALTGIVLGQVIRRVRTVSDDYASRLSLGRRKS